MQGFAVTPGEDDAWLHSEQEHQAQQMFEASPKFFPLVFPVARNVLGFQMPR